MTVCTGNICRSPMAEVVLRERLAEAGLADRVVVDSTGVSSEETGNPMDRRALDVLRAAGYSDVALRSHTARQVTVEQLGDRDLVVAMTADHARALRRLLDGSRGTPSNPDLRMFRSFDAAAPRTDDDRDLDVADPWYGGPEDFDVCLEQVEAAVEGIVAHVREAVARR